MKILLIALCWVVLANTSCAEDGIFRYANDTVASAQPLKDSSAAVSVRGIYRAFVLAKLNEPTFQIAKAEFEANQVNASIAQSAYYPQLQLTKSKLDTEPKPRTTMMLSQPIIALDRWATYRETPYREEIASATYEQRDLELAGRVLTNISDLVRYSENLRSNQSKIESLKQQYESAQKMHQLGQGTITDVGDTRVRLGQAKADGLNLAAKLEDAKRLYKSICGELPNLTELNLVKRSRKLMELEKLPDIKDSNPQVNIAIQNVELADLATLKAKAAVLPSVMGVVSKTQSAGVSSSYMGISISMPLQASGLYGISSARANEMKMREQLRETEQKVQLNIDSLKQLIQSGIIESGVRLETIEAAEVNIDSNQKSFKGGVRSKTDVLNAIQLLYQANDDYVTAILNLAGNYMNYLLAVNVRTDTALELVNTFLFN